LEETARKVEAKGVRCIRLAAELDQPHLAEELALRAEKASGGIDILYNNAAIMTKYRPEAHAPSEEYIQSFLVNLVAPVRITDVILPQMLARGFGRIVQVTSGIMNEPELMPYAVSKAALDKYVRDSVKRIKGSDVLMNLLDPGWLRTDLGGPNAPHDVGDVLPGALVPALLEKGAGSGELYRALEYRRS
jgi:3-oxoacyl-[acyl-carrier protein] reductase